MYANLCVGMRRNANLRDSMRMNANLCESGATEYGFAPAWG